MYDQDVALLAHQANIGLNHIYQKNMPGRIDPRQFLNYPQQQFHQQNVGGVEEYGLPGAIPANHAQLPMIMRTADGKVINLAELVEGGQPSTQQPSGNPNTFQIPNYSNYQSGNIPKIETISDVELILKEIKSMKKVINKLIREFEKSKLPVSSKQTTIQSEDIDDSDSQPTVPTTTFSIPNFGDK